MSHSHEKGLLYGLEARIGPAPAFFAALQHLLASVVGIITPPDKEYRPVTPERSQ